MSTKAFEEARDNWWKNYNYAVSAGFRKQGGTMNRINYFQQGGQQQAPQQGNEQE